MKTRILLAAAALLAALSASASWDLGVAWLERSEKHPVPLEAFGVSDFPGAGDTVHWTAHLYMNTDEQDGEAEALLRWRLNGEVFAARQIRVPKQPGLYAEKVALTLPAGYVADFSRPLANVLRCEIVHPAGGGDARPGNDALEIFLEALPLKVRIYWETFAKYTVPGPGAGSFYDRLEESLQYVHGRLAARSYPAAPHGIIDRFRIDRCEMMEEPADTTYGRDEDYFLTIVCSEGGPQGGYMAAPYYWIGHNFLSGDQGLFSPHGLNALTHELGHALNFPDMYRFNMEASDNAVGGFAWQPLWGDREGFVDIMRYNYEGLRNCFTEYECLAINRFAGQLRRRLPEVYKGQGGWMMKWLPRTVAIRTAPGAQVKIYRGTGEGYYLKFQDPSPAFQGAATNGVFAFTPDYAASASHINRNCFLVELPNREFHVIDTMRLNFAYMQGQTNTAVFAAEELK